MAGIREKISVPLPEGTPVFKVNGTEKKPIGLSADWNTRARPQGRTAGCPSWIDSIVVAPTFDAATKVKKLVQNTAIASSSFSSRDVSVIHVDDNGDTTKEESVPFLFIPKFQMSTKIPGHEGIAVPVAEEIWFSTESFESALAKLGNPEVTDDVEHACAGESISPNV